MEFRIISSAYVYRNTMSQKYGSEEVSNKRTNSLIFEITPDSNYKIIFSDETIFTGYQNRFLFKDKKYILHIARLIIFQSDNDEPEINNFVDRGKRSFHTDRYIAYEPDKSNNDYLTSAKTYDINIYYSLPKFDFAVLRDNIVKGINPTTISLYFGLLIDNDVLEYGCEPDGSSLKWNISKGKSINIEEIGFEFKNVIDGPELEYLDDKYKFNTYTVLKNIEEKIQIFLKSHSKTNEYIKTFFVYLFIVFIIYILFYK